MEKVKGPIFLGKSSGFPYRFGTFTGPTPFLPELHPYLEDLEPQHRSIITLDRVRRDVLAFGNPNVESTDPLWRVVFHKVARDFALPERVKMLHVNEVWDRELPIWSSSPGLPYRLRGYRTKGEVRDNPSLRNDIRWFIHEIKVGNSPPMPDSCAYVRSHLAGDGEEKVRAVWGYPMSVVIAEATFALPLIDVYSKGGYPMAYTYDTAVGGTRKIIKRFRDQVHNYALDYKSFDKTVPDWLVRKAYYILEQNIDFSHYQNYGVADARGTLRLWDALREYCICTPIRLPDGSRYRKRNGIASGTYFTQLVGSIVNALVINYACLKYDGCFPTDYLVFGDDSIFSTKQEIPMEHFVACASEIGMMINAKKSKMSRDIVDLEFLGYALTNGFPTKPFAKWMYSLLYPEHPDREWSDVASRALGLYYANLGQNGTFHRVLYEIVTRHPFDLRLSKDMTKMLTITGFGLRDVSNKELPNALDLAMRFVYR